jgi:hypothetical protein
MSVDKQSIQNEISIWDTISVVKFAHAATIREDGLVDVRCRVSVPQGYHQIPFQFGIVHDNFDAGDTLIDTLRGSPHHVLGWYSCNHTNITSLQYSPSRVGGDFYCNDTAVQSLQYAPQYVGGTLYCRQSAITTLHNIHLTNPSLEIGGYLHLPHFCTHLLGLAYIPGVKRIRMGLLSNQIDVIHDVFEWQEKLFELGLAEQAQL